MTSLVVDAKPWTRGDGPGAILAVRLQCLGDLVGVLPYLYQVREAHPESRLDLLTRDLYSGFIDTIRWIDNAVYLGRSWTDRQAAFAAVKLLPQLVRARYDVVIDLQGSPLTRRIRRILRPAAWTHFDRFSPRPGCERIRDTVERAGIGGIRHRAGIGRFPTAEARDRLRALGWGPEESLVLLNPGSHIPTRQWPTERWAELAAALVREWPEPVRILLLGVERIKDRTDVITKVPGLPVIDLVDATDLGELGPLCSLVKLAITEDGGLSHLASSIGVPTVALLPGGSADVWVRHVGPHTVDLTPSGFDCAPCLDTVCRYGDMRCAQWTVEDVLAAARGLRDRAGRTAAGRIPDRIAD